MSVAFRRESDEEHREPRFELPLPPGPNLVTARGLVLIEAAVHEREAALATAADAAAAEALRRELRYWHTRRATAVPTAPVDDGTVGFGTTVTFRRGGDERAMTIVGDDEADPETNRLAWSAPLARAMAGAEAGERVAFGGRANAITIVAVAISEEEA